MQQREDSSLMSGKSENPMNEQKPKTKKSLPKRKSRSRTIRLLKIGVVNRSLKKLFRSLRTTSWKTTPIKSE